MIKTIRINIPFSETENMHNVLESKLAEFGLTISDIELKGIKSRESYDSTSHYGNWVYIPAKDIPELRKTDLRLDMPRFILEQNDVENLKVGDRVSFQYTNGLAGQSMDTGKILEIATDYEMTRLTISRGKSRSKGYRFYTGDSVRIEKI